jgi:hypothetical protein
MNHQLAVDEDGPFLLITYRLHCRATWAADSPKISCCLHEVRCTDTAVLVEVELQQQEFAVALQRVVFASGNLVVAQKQRAVCTAAGRAVRLVRGRVSGCVRLISKALYSIKVSIKHSPASWNAKRIASAASRLHPRKFNFKSAAMAYQMSGQDPSVADVARCSSTDRRWSEVVRPEEAAAVQRPAADVKKMLAFMLAMEEVHRCWWCWWQSICRGIGWQVCVCR